MNFLLLLFLFASSSAYAGGSGFVGNGGDGVAIDGQLFLRDLWEQNNGNNPFIGAEIDPALPALPDAAAMPFVFPRDLLARKLTDLNQACPGLGDFVLAAMKNYTFVLEDFPLTPIINSDDPVVIPDAAGLVQIANRFGGTIRIQTASFAKLAPSNQVALLIHEAVYSLVTPMAKPDGTWEQPSYVAREITGSFFNKSFLAKPPDVILSTLGGLGIPHELLPLSLIRQLPRYEMSYGYMTASNQEVQVGRSDFDFKVNQTFTTLQSSVASVCKIVPRTHLHLSARNAKSLWVQTSYVKRPVILKTHQYLAAPQVQQISITIEQQTNSPNGSFYFFKDIADCSGFFDADIDALITGNWDI